MPLQVLLPSNVDLQRIERDFMAQLTMDDPIFDIFPPTPKDATVVEWEQQANLTGLMAPRGVNGQPSTVKLKGGNRFEMKPAGYGEAVLIDEEDIEERRQWGSTNAPMPLDDLVYEGQDYLLNRRINRMRYVGWTLLGTGAYSIPNPSGGFAITDAYSFQTLNAAFTWSNLTQATPLADFRALAPLQAGHTVKFGKKAKAYMNRIQLNYMLNNQNANDIGGKRVEIGASILTLDDINKINAAQDLPQIVEWDEGFYPDGGGSFTRWIPTGTVIVVGDRPAGQTVGQFQMTRNAVNEDGQPGAYTLVFDSLMTGRPVPRFVEVHDGFKGGIACFYPTAIVTVTA